MSQAPKVHVHLLPALIPPGLLRGGVAVVVDVLRATTAMVHALNSGIESIRPCVEVEEAHEIVATLGRDRTLLGGERQGVVIPGFELGNSPTSYTPEVCRGKTLVITTTNGTRAIQASLEADRVLISAFVNLGATLRALDGTNLPIHVVCAGTNDRVSLEDSLFAGAFIAGLADRRAASGVEPLDAEDEAVLVARAWREFEIRAVTSADRTKTLAEELTRGRGGRRVRELGYDRDIHAAATIDHFNLVAELSRDPIRVVVG